MVQSSIARARKLRRLANYPERKAWETLRSLRKQGFSVRRQVPIAGLTVDFAIRSKRLVVEIDGSIHDLEAVQLNDAIRDDRLKAARWRVIRIPASLALSPDHLLQRVLEAIEE
jgi:very-short-patch-repair endonuclease